MGSVYEVIHPELKKRFAIKTLLPNLAVIPEARARFLREGEAASRISHPNVVDVTDVGMEDGTPFLVMEFLEGETLGATLDVRGALRFSEAIDFLLPILSAVVAGHDEGVIHRDLKPQNVFLCKGRWGEILPKVLDFGVSKLMNSSGAAGALTGTMAVLGTAAYMSPEQARGARDVNARSDQYALGLIFYEMLTARRTYPGDNPLEVLHKIGTGQFDPPRLYRPDMPVEIEAVLLRMLALDANDRFPSLRDVGRALMPFAGEKARLNWSDAFRVGADAPTLPGALRSGPPHPGFPAGSPGSGGPTQPRGRSPSSSSGAVAGGTRVLPVQSGFPRSNPSTTFNNGAAEMELSRTDLRGSSGSRRGLWLGAMVLLGVGLGGGGWWLQSRRDLASRGTDSRGSETGAGSARSGSEAPKRERERASGPIFRSEHETRREPMATRTLNIRAIPREALLVLDDGPPTKGEMRATLPVDDATHVLRVTADGYVTKSVAFGPTDTPPNEVELDAEPMRQPTTPQTTATRSPRGKGATNSKGSSHSKGSSSHDARTDGRTVEHLVRPTSAGDTAPVTQPPPAQDSDNELHRGVNNALIIR